MPVVNWVPQPVKKNLSFDSVAVNQNFKIVSTALKVLFIEKSSYQTLMDK